MKGVFKVTAKQFKASVKVSVYSIINYFYR